MTLRSGMALNNTVRFIENVPHGWIVQERRTAPTSDKWWYADSPFWLALTPAEFVELQAAYLALRTPTTPVAPPPPAPENDPDLEMFL